MERIREMLNRFAGAMAIAVIGAHPAMAYEQPSYTVERAEGHFELRRYAPRVVAETLVEGEFEASGTEAFRRLAGYIGGANRGRASIAMTAPVTQESGSEKIKMTAPVTQEADGSRFRFTFTMPAEHTLETLPEPLDDRVLLRAEPPRRVAAVRYRGTWSRALRDRTGTIAAVDPCRGPHACGRGAAGLGPLRPALHAVVPAPQRSLDRGRRPGLSGAQPGYAGLRRTYGTRLRSPARALIEGDVRRDARAERSRAFGLR
jgi:hypothetical protein